MLSFEPLLISGDRTLRPFLSGGCFVMWYLSELGMAECVGVLSRLLSVYYLLITNELNHIISGQCMGLFSSKVREV